jgi:hypothetical protein
MGRRSRTDGASKRPRPRRSKLDLPPTWRCRSTATNDHRLGICIWEGESVDAVREVVERAVGPWADNEYYEMHVDGLVPQLASS